MSEREIMALVDLSWSFMELDLKFGDLLADLSRRSPTLPAARAARRSVSRLRRQLRAVMVGIDHATTDEIRRRQLAG